MPRIFTLDHGESKAAVIHLVKHDILVLPFDGRRFGVKVYYLESRISDRLVLVLGGCKKSVL